MQSRITLITLGVQDIALARAFYEALGWKASSASQPEVVFMQGNGFALALFGREALAADAGVHDTAPGFSGITLAWNGRSKAEVDEAFSRALAAGARAVKPPHDTFWGGYSGYVADPDGHLWELAWNPFFPLDERGNLHLPNTTP
jgi:catechol 2,3-dioxygenase-like lactoylglutathione lyase family enzyme